MPDDPIIATYRIETAFPLEQAAEAMAGEQSCGTFIQVPGETDELRRRHRARVMRITELEAVDEPTLPGAAVPRGEASPRYRRAQVELAFPFDNIGSNLPTLIATVAGNLFELRQFSGLRLMDLQLPGAFVAGQPRPQFGIAGTRRLAGVHDRPIIGTIVKPSVGLSPRQTGELVRTLAEAGIDFIKDDELIANPPHSPLRERVEHVMRAIRDAADRTGRKTMYAFNISDGMDAMLEHHDTVREAGGTCVMVSLNSVGHTAVAHLRSRSALPIHGHRNGWGMLTRCPELGIAFPVYQKLWRLAGADHLHVNGLQNKFWEPDDSVVASLRSCLTPMLGDDDRAMPVVSSGQWGGQAPQTLERTGGTVDLMYVAGGGIWGHPGGPASGLAAIRQAWEAAAAGIDLQRYAHDHPELAQSLAHFGKVEHVAGAAQPHG